MSMSVSPSTQPDTPPKNFGASARFPTLGNSSPVSAVGETLTISRWSDPLVDRLGHDPRSRYVELFWLPILGPSTVLFLRHCVTLLEEATTDGEVELDLSITAARLGLGHKGGRNSPLVRTVLRATRFGAARPAGARALQVRRFLAPLNRGQVERLPLILRTLHQRAVSAQPGVDEFTKARARRLALGLIQCGDMHDSAEAQLSQWQVPSIVAAEAVRWAWEIHLSGSAVGNDAA